MTQDNAGLEQSGVQYILDDTQFNAALDRINKKTAELFGSIPASLAGANKAFDQFQKSANVAFSEQTGRYVDTTTKKLVSNGEALARLTAATLNYEKALVQTHANLATADSALEKYGQLIEQQKAAIEASDLKDKEKSASLTALDRAYKQLITDVEALHAAQEKGLTGPALPTAQVQQSTQAIDQLAAATKKSIDSTNDQSQSHITLARQLGVSRLATRVFVGDIANLVDKGGRLSPVFSGLLAALSPIDYALVAFAAGIQLGAQALDSSHKSFLNEIDVLARTTTGLEEYTKAREAAARAKPLGGAGAEELPGLLLKAIPAVGALDAALGQLTNRQAAQAESLLKLEKGEIALGTVHNARLISMEQSIEKAAGEGASLADLFDKTVQLKIATGEITEEQAKNRDELAKLAPELIQAALGYQRLGIAAAAAARAQEQIRASQEKVTELLSRAGTATANAIDQEKRAETERNVAINGIHADLQTKINKIDAKGVDERLKIDASYTESIGRINADLAASEETAYQNLQDKLGQIVANGKERQAQIGVRFNEQNARITEKGIEDELRIIERKNEQLDAIRERGFEEAVRNAERRDEQIAQAEATARESEEREQERFRDRAIEIEQQYQDKLRGIKEDYAQSEFEASAHVDAKALIEAKRTRARALRDAEEAKKKETDKNQEDHDKAEKAIADALEKARAKAVEEYQKAQKDLEASLEKQRAKAKEEAEKAEKELKASLEKQRVEAEKEREKALKELAASLEKQRAEAIKSYDKQVAEDEKRAAAARTREGEQHQQQLDALDNSLGEQRQAEKDNAHDRELDAADAFQHRLDAIGEALGKEKDLYGAYGVEIRQALKDALNPDDLAEIINAAEKELERRITVTIAPLDTSGQRPNPNGPTEYQIGGYNPIDQLARIHAGEWIIPNPIVAGEQRTRDVLGAMSASRTDYLPQPRQTAMSVIPAPPQRVDIYVTSELKDEMLNLRIDTRAHNALTRVIQEARR